MGTADAPPRDPFSKNRRVPCKGRSVIRYTTDVRERGELVHRKGDPVLNEDHGRTYRPCQAWAANGTEHCINHGGSAPQTIAAAKRTLALAADDMAAVLRGIAEDERVPYETRLKAAATVLDRVGVKGGVDVALETPGWQKILGNMFGVGEQSESDADGEGTGERAGPVQSESDAARARDDAADPSGIIRARVRKLTTPQAPEPVARPRKAAKSAAPVAPTPKPRKATRRAAPDDGRPKFQGW